MKLSKKLLPMFLVVAVACSSASDSCTGPAYNGCDLRGIDFSHQFLEDQDFGAADLRNANFSGASLAGSTFGNYDLS